MPASEYARDARWDCGGWWVRTTVGNCRQIYSLLPLTARATLRKRCNVKKRLLACSNRVAELATGLEPTAACLQNRCSTVELRQPRNRALSAASPPRPTGRSGGPSFPVATVRRPSKVHA